MNKISDDILCKVEKPSRYVGGELNQVIKDPKDVDIRFAFCFPDVYEVGMSHLGTRILYHTINLREDTYCERTFAPWPDMEELMRKNNIEPKRIRFIYPKENTESNLVLIDGKKNGNPGLKILPPLVVHNNDESYTEEVLKMFGSEN